MPDPVKAALTCMEATIDNNSSLYKYLKKSFKDECISTFFKGFYSFFYDNGYDYDINGFSLVFFMPPHLSGFGWPTPHELIAPNHSAGVGIVDINYLDFITFALEVTPPDIGVEKGSLGMVASDTFDYPTHIHSSPDISLSYLDTSKLKLYNFHSAWVRYIQAVVSGLVSPAPEYLEVEDYDIIDYLGSLYILKFDSTMFRPVMISKAIGLFPNAVPFKESIGPKGQHQITISNVAYTCSYFYEEPIDENAIENPLMRRVLFKEFMERYEPAFKQIEESLQSNE
jgi:hypothetical protein